MRLQTHDNQHLFGQASEAFSETSDDSREPQSVLTKIVVVELLQTVTHHSGISLDQWVLEPDALHAIVTLQEDRPMQEVRGKPKLLTLFVAELKAATAKRISLVRNQPGSSVWRRSYKEQRVEDDTMLARLRKKLRESDSIVAFG